MTEFPVTASFFRVALPDALAGRIDGKAPHQEGFRWGRIEAGLQDEGSLPDVDQEIKLAAQAVVFLKRQRSVNRAT